MKKILVAVSMAALLFASCSNYAANDKLDAPEVVATATDNGVVVLSWEKVKDANTTYTVMAKVPGAEEFSSENFEPISTSNSGRQSVAFKVYENNADYTFKVIANSDKTNVIASETEVTVTTPEEWKDLAFDASSIKVSLVGNTKNSYNVFVKSDLGYKYEVRETVDAIDAKIAFNKASNGTNKDGSTVVKVVKEEEVDGETKDVVQAAWMASLSAGRTPKYAVVKATPINDQIAKPVYAITATPVKYDFSADFSTVSGLAVTKESSTTARVTFNASQVNYTDAAADSFVIYRATTSYINKVRGTETASAVKIGTAKLANPTTYNNGDVLARAKYYFDDTIDAYKADVGGVSKYTYFVVNANGEASGTVDLDNTVTSNNAATAEAAALTNNAYVNLTVAAGATAGTAKFTVTAKKGTTVAVTYAKYATKAAAQAAVDAEITTAIPMNLKGAVGTLTTQSTTVDGVKSETTNQDTQTYESSDFALEVGVKVSKSTSADLNTQSSTTTNKGAWYVVKAAGTNGDAAGVAYKLVWLEETTNAMGNTSTTTKEVKNSNL